MSRPSSALVPIGKEEEEEEEDGYLKDVKLSEWFCHCCNKKNDGKATKCVVCGRGEDFANRGFPFPLHGYGAQIFRASQVEKVLPDVYASDESGWTPRARAKTRRRAMPRRWWCAEAQGTMLSLIEILSNVQSQLQAVGANENLPVDGAVLAATVEQVRQQQMVEMTVFERLVAMSSDDGSGGGDLYPRRPSPPYPYACRIHPDRQHTSIRTLTPPPTGQESELVTLTSCFSYMPYVDAHHIASVLAV